MADFKGLKTRTYDKNSANCINMAGGNAVALAWGEVYSALRTGLVNSVVTSSASGKDGKFWEVLNYFTKINYAYPLQAVTINLDYWNSLSKAQQQAILKAAKEMEKYQWDASKKEDAIALKTLADHGMKIEEATPELKKGLSKIADKLLNQFLQDASPAIKKIFKEYRK
jgi:TRAP-type C4-dicarboxylate transport system substrate-binding protein